MSTNAKKLGLLILIVLLSWCFLGCAMKNQVGIRKSNDMKQERVVKKDPFADISVDPAEQQMKEKNDVIVAIKFLRVMDESDYNCIDKSYNPLNPQLLFAYRMLNHGEKIRHYAPVFAFKGTKTLDLATSDPCKFFNTYGEINYLIAKPGYKFFLECGAKGTQKTEQVSQTGQSKVTLYPDIPVYGILIVSQHKLENVVKNEEGVEVSKVEGWAAFYEEVDNRKPNSFRFDYLFSRQDWKEDVAYKKYTPYTYEEEVYQKEIWVPILGSTDDGKEYERIPNSEDYGEPSFERIGIVQKDSK